VDLLGKEMKAWPLLLHVVSFRLQPITSIIKRGKKKNSNKTLKQTLKQLL